MSIFHEDARVREAAERCARLAVWEKVETDPRQKEIAKEALQDARNRLASEVDRYERDRAPAQVDGAQQMFPDGSVTDVFKKLDDAMGQTNAAEASGKERNQDADARSADADAPTNVEIENATEREASRALAIEPPKEIEALPDYQKLYEAELHRLMEADMARNMEEIAEDNLPQGEDVNSIGRTAAASYRYAPQDQVPELDTGGEIEGTVSAIENRDGQAYYIVENDDGHKAAVPVDEDLDLEPGDAISASRNKDGSYGISRDADYGM